MQSADSLRKQYNHINEISRPYRLATFNPFSRLYRRLRKRMRRRGLL